MAKSIDGAKTLFQQKLEDTALFATGAEGTEDLAQTIHMRYALDLPQKYYAQTGSSGMNTNQDDDGEGEGEDEDEDQQVAMAQRQKSAKGDDDEKKKDDGPAEEPEKVEDHFNPPHAKTRTTFYDHDHEATANQ